MRELRAVVEPETHQIVVWKCTKCEWVWPSSDNAQIMQRGTHAFHEHRCEQYPKRTFAHVASA